MSNDPTNEQQLDNAVWHALRGPLAGFVVEDSGADWLRFQPDVGVFSGVERLDPQTWRRVAEIAGLGGTCGFFRDVIGKLPGGWGEEFRGECLQMIAGDLAGGSSLEIEVLDECDAAEMLALAELTEPGPYFIRTRELGRYVGVRRNGHLVAMAGERFRVPGFVEISAVCTHPEARGQGLAAALTLEVANSIRSGGDEAFLHVLDDNENAIRLYRELGFSVRRKVEVVFARWHGADWVPEEG
jgi:predicted GNAT family acetyltransferase